MKSIISNIEDLFFIPSKIIYLLFGLWLVYKLLQNNSIAELYFIEYEDSPIEFKEYVDKIKYDWIYPIGNIFSFIFWIFIGGILI